LSRETISSREPVGYVGNVAPTATSKTVTGGATGDKSVDVALDRQEADEPPATERQASMIRARLSECGLKNMRIQDAWIKSWLGCSSVEEIPKRKVSAVVSKVESLGKKDIEEIIISSFQEAAETIHEHFEKVFGRSGRKNDALRYICIHMANGATADDLLEWIGEAVSFYKRVGYHPEELPWPELFFNERVDWKNRKEDSEPLPVPGLAYVQDFGGCYIFIEKDDVRKWMREQRMNAGKGPAPVS
jgi:hypothetical protein